MPCTLLWFRHNLRLADNRALQSAQESSLPVAAVYAFTPELVRQPHRASFVYQCLQQLYHDLHKLGIPLYIQAGSALEVVCTCAKAINAKQIIAAEGYDPSARAEENQLWHALSAQQCTLQCVNDSVALARADVMSNKGQAFNQFSGYQSAWHHAYSQRLSAQPQMCPPRAQTPLPMPHLPTPKQLGFALQNLILEGGEAVAQQHWQHFSSRMAMYPIERDFPAKRSTSQLSVYLRFGVLSPRQLIAHALKARHEGAQLWLTALIWREFYQQFLYHYPHSAQQSYRPEYRQLTWQGSESDLQRWQQGKTGYPIVDAAMRQLMQNGYLHHRLRMIVAEFLVKDLLIDWRAGAAWFAEKLLDHDPATNIGNWQRIAGVGGEALPTSRMLNPVLQSQKYDPDGQYIRRFIPELAHLSNDTLHAPWLARESIHTNGYPAPMVIHSQQKAKTQYMYQQASLRNGEFYSHDISTN